MEKIRENVGSILEAFQQLTKRPEYFLESNDTLKNDIKKTLKQAYDTTKSEELRNRKSTALPELIIKHFDIEQIWQQIELQNESIVSNTLTNVSKLVTSKDGLLFTDFENEISSREEKDEPVVAEEEQSMNFNDNSGDDNDSSDDNSLALDSNDDEIDLNDINEDEDSGEEVTKKEKSNAKKSIVDDEFFSLNEMEKFVQAEEKKIQNENSGNESEESLSDEEEEEEVEGNIDLFENDPEDEEEKMKTARFKDFFVAKENTTKSKRRRRLDSSGSDNESGDDLQKKSSLELRQDRLKRRIDEIEQNNVSEKPWQLKGEITADNRPQNSLLEEIVEFDLTSRPAPIITEQTTLQLEDIIKQRIKDRVFDSVLRKAKPVETPLEYKKKLVLDQEKSKQSLAQIYEKEFLDKQTSLDPDSQDKEEPQPELHKEVKTLMRNLFNKLDALSNFHFTPKPAVPELRVVNNLPAINVEEVAPVAASDGALLAPEEVRNKTRGEIVGKMERTSTDKNRERRKKKRKQRAHLKEKQKRENLGNPLTQNKYGKKANKDLAQLTKSKNIQKMDVSNEKIKSSKAFFTQLQEEVQTQISKKIKSKGPKKQKQHLEAKRMKL